MLPLNKADPPPDVNPISRLKAERLMGNLVLTGPNVEAWFYLDSVGVAGIGSAGSRVVNAISRVAARLVGGQPEQRPAALLEPQRLPLDAGEVILAFESQTPQRLSVQASQFGVHPLPIVNVAQEGLKLQRGAQIRRQTRFGAWERCAELRGRRASDAAPAVDAEASLDLQRLVQRPGPGRAPQRGVAMFQGLIGRENGPRVNGTGW